METWEVRRWSGRGSDDQRSIFSGDEAAARARYAKEVEALRQGEVLLCNPQGDCVESQWAPRLRSRW